MRLDRSKTKDAFIAIGSNLITIGVAASVLEDVVSKVTSISVLIIGIIFVLFGVFNKENV